MKVIQLSLLIMSVFLITPAKAALLIEPAVGYSFGEIQADESGAKKIKNRGLSYGGRFGYQNLGFQLGLDYLSSSLDTTTSGFKGDLDTTEWAAFVGFRFPVMLKAYAGYIFSADADAKFNDYGKVKFRDGSGMKLGIGFTGLPLVDLNLEYRKGKYGKTEGDKTLDTDFSAYMIALSLPLNF